jgi:hypothetical protein
MNHIMLYLRFSGVLILLSLSITLSSQSTEGFRFQAVARDASNNILINQPITITAGILADAENGELVWEEQHTETTNDLGLFTLDLCKDINKRTGGSAASVSDILWGSTSHFLHLQIDLGNGPVNLGTQQILSVPYAQYAFGANEIDGDPANEIQDLQLSGTILSLTKNPTASQIDLGAFNENSVGWNRTGSNVVYVNGNVGVGTITPEGRLTVQGVDETDNQALFEVRRKDGYPVFAVYEDGVWAFTDTAESVKGVKGGFAVGGYSKTSKGLAGKEFFRVTPDSVRIYINDEIGTGVKGGFAVGGYRQTDNGPSREFFRVTDDSTRIYVDAPAAKGVKGGFAVGGYSRGKLAEAESFMSLTPDNYFIGHNSGQYVTLGLQNSVLGYESGQALTEGSKNAFLGYRSGYKNSSGNGNTFLGTQSGASNVSGNANSFIGSYSGEKNSAGNYNTFIGSYSGNSNTTGSNNTMLGYETGYSNQDGGFNAFIGYRAGYNNIKGASNIFLGNRAGYSNTEGGSNVFMGNNTGHSNLVGNNNMFLGNNAGYSNDSSNNNIFIGYYAGNNHQKGDHNLFIGTDAGRGHSDGQQNIFIGSYAGRYAEGNGNISVGYRSGETNTTGYSNVFISVASGLKNTEGYSNVFIGDQAGVNNTTGYENVILGRAAGYTNSLGSRNVCIGWQAGFGEQGSNRLHIGYPTLIYGEFDNRLVGINNTNPTETLDVNGNIKTRGNMFFHPGSDRAISFPDATKTLLIGGASSDNGPWGVLTKAVGFIGMYLDGAYQSGIRLVGTGQVGLGVLSPTYRLQLANNADAAIGKGIAQEWATYSDSRIKADFESLPYGLEELMQLRPKKYTQYNSQFEDNRLVISEDHNTNIGLVAQDVVDIIPEAVNKPWNEEEELWSISYEKLIPVLINGIQEQQQIIEEQDSRMKNMQAEIDELKLMMSGLLQ